MTAKDVSEEDRQQFAAWLACDRRHAAAYRQAEAVLQVAPIAARRVQRRLWRTAPAWMTPRRLLMHFSYVAALALFVALDGPMYLRADHRTDLSETAPITLDDGSVVQLDKSSSIALKFSRSHRRVELLRGEAYFRVAADSLRPFVVRAGGASVTALGTAFDVRLTADGGEITVAEHAVSVDVDNGDRHRFVLKEGERVAYSRDGKVGPVETVDRAVIETLRSDRIVVENEPLGSIVDRMNRRSATRVVLANESLARRRVSGTFDIANPARALDVIEQSLGLRSVRVGTLLVVLY
jgi:transmembrane sensor